MLRLQSRLIPGKRLGRRRHCHSLWCTCQMRIREGIKTDLLWRLIGAVGRIFTNLPSFVRRLPVLLLSCPGDRGRNWKQWVCSSVGRSVTGEGKEAGLRGRNSQGLKELELN